MDTANVYLLNKDGDVQYGLNWAFEPDTDNLRIEKGRTETSRDGNEGYLQLSPEVWHSEFFPVRGNYFYAVADDGQEFIFERVSKNDEGTQLSTPEDNHIIGKWIRKRLGVKDCSKIKKSDIDAYGRSSIKFTKITDRYYKMDFSNSNSFPLPFPHNRIIFGAPGTGKSYKLKDESTYFETQQQINEDVNTLIKNRIAVAISGAKKLTALNAIGFKYAEVLKKVEKKDFAGIYGVQNFDELYVGSRAKEFADQLVIDTEDFEESLKRQIESAKSGKNMFINLNAIGYKYTDYLSEKTMNELKSNYILTSDAQVWWLYKGIQAGQIEIEKDTNDKIPFLERVTFHPNYSYAQFVGAYKPVKSDLNSADITYSYIPGPFIRVLQNALLYSERDFLLIIEEINRANVAAVFGDVFQLLDRKDGESEYKIATSEDLRKYLISKGIDEDKATNLSIPSNMYIWATMNSADQGVQPLDTAFKRRWDFEYIGINDGEGEIKDFHILVPTSYNESTKEYTTELVSWNELRKAINKKLSDANVNEDKLLGPFFISKSMLEKHRKTKTEQIEKDKNDEFIKHFKSKVLMYLFEDAAKMVRTRIFANNNNLFSELCKNFDSEGIKIFGFSEEEIKKIKSEGKTSESSTNGES